MPSGFTRLLSGSGSNKVMTPRNVELPMHALSGAGAGSSMAMLNNGGTSNGGVGPKAAKKDGGSTKKICLCLWAWLAGLVLLCAAAVAVANHILSDGASSSAELRVAGVLGAGGGGGGGGGDNRKHVCLQSKFETLERKAELSELILVGKLDTVKRKKKHAGNGGDADKTLIRKIKIKDVIKGEDIFRNLSSRRNSLLYREEQDSPCQVSLLPAVEGTAESSAKKIFFLKRLGGGGEGGEWWWAPRFRAVRATTRLTQALRRAAEKTGGGGGVGGGREEHRLSSEEGKN